MFYYSNLQLSQLSAPLCSQLSVTCTFHAACCLQHLESLSHLDSSPVIHHKVRFAITVSIVPFNNSYGVEAIIACSDVDVDFWGLSIDPVGSVQLMPFSSRSVATPKSHFRALQPASINPLLALCCFPDMASFR
ncbi:hypothetical protein OUZ56_011927 [Daphnia magna]|uniref:Uncharacterized protein n=1 Tax=Daphnia magna TaxID=35525 RepID=A0ABQ9Z1I7_9CRUS|nr:hypothetical protein OUZ56_011927 [Daphnia magna]